MTNAEKIAKICRVMPEMQAVIDICRAEGLTEEAIFVIVIRKFQKALRGESIQ